MTIVTGAPGRSSSANVSPSTSTLRGRKKRILIEADRSLEWISGACVCVGVGRVERANRADASSNRYHRLTSTTQGIKRTPRRRISQPLPSPTHYSTVAYTPDRNLEVGLSNYGSTGPSPQIVDETLRDNATASDTSLPVVSSTNPP